MFEQGMLLGARKHIPSAFERHDMSALSDRRAVGSAVGGGGIAYLLGYVVTYAVSIPAVRDATFTQIAEALGGGNGTEWKIVGWIFYNAHGVRTTLEVSLPVFGGQSAVNLIARSGLLSPVLYLVPPALLLAAGLATVRAAGIEEVDVALRLGLAVAVGYLPLALVGAVLFTVAVPGSTGKPTLLPAIGLAGIVYPAVFGGAGAAVGAVASGAQ